MNEAWDEVSPLIEEISLRGKYALKYARSQSEIDEIVSNAVNQLDAIGEIELNPLDQFNEVDE